MLGLLSVPTPFSSPSNFLLWSWSFLDTNNIVYDINLRELADTDGAVPNNRMATVTKKTVLITGCTTGGIGWAMAKVFHTRGYYVFATVRGGQASKAEGLSELGDVEILNVDVTDTDTIARAKDVVAKRTGGRLDVLMNNAGAEFVCPLLDTDIAEAKKLFDVNVWGPLAMLQAFAPLLVAAKGLVSNHTSIASVLPLAWAGMLLYPLAGGLKRTAFTNIQTQEPTRRQNRQNYESRKSCALSSSRSGCVL